MMQAAPEPTTPATYNHINETELELKIVESKIGDEVKYTPKMVSKGTDFHVWLTLPAFQTLFSQLGTDGDKLGDKEKFNKPIEQACATLTLTKGAPKKVLRGGNTILTEQDNAFTALKTQMTDLVKAAWESNKVKCAGKDKARKKAKQQLKAEGNKKPSDAEISAAGLKIYLEDAHHSGMREMEWTDNGEAKEGIVLKAKRKVRGVRYITEKDDNGNEIILGTITVMRSYSVQ